MTAREYLEQHPTDYDPDVWAELIQYEQTHPEQETDQ